MFSAPVWRAISDPRRNRMIVGIPESENWAAVCVAASVSSLARRNPGDNSAAASANEGAIIRQGPHQDAQKSTRTGTSDRDTNLPNVRSVNSIGVAGNNGVWHLPQIGRSSIRSLGTRLTARQSEQTRLSGGSVIAMGHRNGVEDGMVCGTWRHHLCIFTRRGAVV